MMDYSSHYSVLNKESIEQLVENCQSECLYTFADMTFGAGGHTFAVAKLSGNFKIIAVDQDPEALANGKKEIKKRELEERVNLLDMNFEKFPKYCQDHKITGLDGIVMDLGVSSHHFDSGERGFSFRFDAPLDMRMDSGNREIRTAADLINELDCKELVSIFQKYGEERFSRRIAEKIIEERSESPIKTTKELEDIIFHCYPKKLRHGKTNPATKCFQALRIAVNRELEVLTEVIPELVKLLKCGGRLAIITFHSLEDRIVKHAFKEIEKGELPVEIITKKPIAPSAREINENSRSRSAKLRVIERVQNKKSKNKYAHFSKTE